MFERWNGSNNLIAQIDVPQIKIRGRRSPCFWARARAIRNWRPSALRRIASMSCRRLTSSCGSNLSAAASRRRGWNVWRRTRGRPPRSGAVGQVSETFCPAQRPPQAERQKTWPKSPWGVRALRGCPQGAARFDAEFLALGFVVIKLFGLSKVSKI